jgi:predicted ArsR family transcriptional regulator
MSPDPISSVAALDEPTRRRLYDHVVAQRRPVGRDEASTALGLSRATAAFHLDKLVEEGLLDVVHERLTGRTGPGAGRPAKLYLRADRQIEVSVPGRRYALAGRLLADAVAEAEDRGITVRDALARLARAEGQQIGAAAGHGDVPDVLAEQGYEPLEEAGLIRLGNCPFHELAQRQTELVCGMNLELVCGVLDGLGDTGHAARLDPEPSYCCVVLERR